MKPSKFTAERAALEALHGLIGRKPAIAAGLKVYLGATCAVRGHGRARLLRNSRCLDCIDREALLKERAEQAGRDAALRKARAELVREAKAAQREAARATARAQKEAEKEQRQRERQRQRRAEKLKAAREARALEKAAQHSASEGVESATPAPPRVSTIPIPFSAVLSPTVPPWELERPCAAEDSEEDLEAGDRTPPWD